jgi:D-aminopeptidase
VPRARDLGLALGLLPPGRLNAITDVAGLRVGHVSIVAGDQIRTGVTALLTHERDPFQEKTPAAAFVLNGFGKTCGLAQVAELGVLETPILLTGTLAVPRVADALIDWTIARNPDLLSVNPVVGECNDGYLNDIQGRHVRAEHVFGALERAQAGPVAEGAVGAGVGMTCYGWKGGIGTSSRRSAEFVVGALVLTNFGQREELRIDGAPVGRELARIGGGAEVDGGGSVMVVVATDAPLDARQLGRVARRGALGLARTGGTAGHGSGDFILAFSNAEPVPDHPTTTVLTRRVLAEDGPLISGLFQATVEAVEEAVINSLLMAETTHGRDGRVRHAIPLEPTLEILRRHGRIANP